MPSLRFSLPTSESILTSMSCGSRPADADLDPSAMEALALGAVEPYRVDDAAGGAVCVDADEAADASGEERDGGAKGDGADPSSADHRHPSGLREGGDKPLLARQETSETHQSSSFSEDESEGDGDSDVAAGNETRAAAPAAAAAVVGASCPPALSDALVSPVSAPLVDLSGDWSLICDASFKSEYADYLSAMGFNRVVRSVALSVISRTSERIVQEEGGRRVRLVSKNPKGTWDRVLLSSSPSGESSCRDDGASKVMTADGESVTATAWWEDSGTKHRSWLKGGTKYGGGDFESLRYLEDGGNVLVCESYFHSTGKNRNKTKRAEVTWRFQRVPKS